MPVKKGDIRPEWVKDKIKATQLLKKEITDIVFKWGTRKAHFENEIGRLATLQDKYNKIVRKKVQDEEISFDQVDEYHKSVEVERSMVSYMLQIDQLTDELLEKLERLTKQNGGLEDGK